MFKLQRLSNDTRACRQYVVCQGTAREGTVVCAVGYIGV
jgi:hypothetical protein